jgi:nicotinate phosphoribosyltransferase
MAIIKSVLDNDFYKLSMQRAVLDRYCGTPVCYKFINRRPEGKFNKKFFAALQDEVSLMQYLATASHEIDRLRISGVDRFLGNTYLQWLKGFRYDPNLIKMKLADNELKLTIVGPWEHAIMWEVPLMAIISELYFQYCDTDWEWDEKQQESQLLEKMNLLKQEQQNPNLWWLNANPVHFADFGTRRRRSYQTQDVIVNRLKHFAGFVGTSNVHLACKHKVKPIGTMAHEFIMGISALESLRHANRYALRAWAKVFKGDLGIALTDTFGTKAFWDDFDGALARLFDGVRHDSGDPFEFIEETIAAYEKLGIDPRTKTIVFSDGLDFDTVYHLNKACWNGNQGMYINCSFGIGTNLTNDFKQRSDPTQVSKPLNMVIKMTHCDNVPVVKLSSVPSKATGEKDALQVAMWTFFDYLLEEPDVEIPEVEIDQATLQEGKLPLLNLLVVTNMAVSLAEARRLVEQGSVRCNDEKSTDYRAVVPVPNGLTVHVGSKKKVQVRLK